MQLNTKKYDAFCSHIFDYACLKPGAYLGSGEHWAMPPLLLILLFSKKNKINGAK